MGYSTSVDVSSLEPDIPCLSIRAYVRVVHRFGWHLCMETNAGTNVQKIIAYGRKHLTVIDSSSLTQPLRLITKL